MTGDEQLAAAERRRSDGDVKLVDEVLVECCTYGRDSPADAHVGASGGRGRLTECGLEPIGDEVERRGAHRE